MENLSRILNFKVTFKKMKKNLKIQKKQRNNLRLRVGSIILKGNENYLKMLLLKCNVMKMHLQKIMGGLIFKKTFLPPFEDIFLC